MTGWTDLYGSDPDYPAQTVEQQYAHALADRLEERAERHERWVRMLDRAAPLDLPDAHAFERRCARLHRHVAAAIRLRTAARVVREEAAR